LNLYQNCIALISPQLEDFGLTQIEAQACGRPVIGFNKGGNTETIVHNKTGILFRYQSTKSLENAITRLTKKNLNTDDCRQQSLKFSEQTFMLHFSHHLQKLWKKHQTTIF
jgi:glycosyltransferase involved in cell wall biosynthesis